MKRPAPLAAAARRASILGPIGRFEELVTVAVNMNRVRTSFSGVSGTPYLATHYFAGPNDAVTAQQCVDAVRDFWAAFKPSLQFNLTWTVLGQVDVITDTTGALVSSNTVTPRSDAATGTGDMLPPATQALVQWSTNNVYLGRRVRGRTFIPAPLETVSNSSGAPTNTLLTNAPTAVTAILGAVPDFVVWSQPRTTGPHAGQPGQAVVVSGGALWSKFAVLRSRRD